MEGAPRTKKIRILKEPVVSSSGRSPMEKQVLTALICLIYACLLRESRAIVGGDPVDDVPQWMASLRDEGKHACGGTLIARNVVLTAAHCFNDQIGAPEIHIGRFFREGEDDFASFSATRVITHPGYNSETEDLDAALIVLDSYSDAYPVELAESDECFQGDGGCEVELLGWGEGENIGEPTERLRQAFTLSMGRSDCVYDLEEEITSSQICAGEDDGGIDACYGDSGGPMLLDNKQVGIVSWGLSCAEEYSPSVYVSIPKIRGWIDSELAKIADYEG